MFGGDPADRRGSSSVTIIKTRGGTMLGIYKKRLKNLRAL